MDKKEEIDLNKAGHRLRDSIEILSPLSFNKFSKSVNCMNYKSVYNLSHKDKLEYSDIKGLIEELPGLDKEYIIDGNMAKRPVKPSFKELQSSADKDLQIARLNREIDTLYSFFDMTNTRFGKCINAIEELKNSNNEILDILKKVSDIVNANNL